MAQSPTSERLTPERRKARTRDALLDAAITVFARRGFHGASLDDIAETAGFTRGAIYKHFDDKEAILLAACERLNDRVISEFAALPGADRPIESTDPGEVAGQWAHSMGRDGDFVIVMLEYQLYALRNPEVQARATAFRHSNAQRIANYMREHMARSGEKLPIAVDDLATIFGITSDAFSQMQLVDDDAVRIYELFLSTFLRGLRAMNEDSPAT